MGFAFTIIDIFIITKLFISSNPLYMKLVIRLANLRYPKSKHQTPKHSINHGETINLEELNESRKTLPTCINAIPYSLDNKKFKN